MNTRKYIGFFIVILLALLETGLAQVGKSASQSKPDGTHQSHVMLTPEMIDWGKPDPSRPPGLQIVTLAGDPMKEGSPFTIRLKMPDGFVIPPHWHPVDENVVVVQGTAMMGTGEKLEHSAAKEMPAGSYGLMPKEMRHYFWAKGETIVHVYGLGPFKTNWVNPEDRPGKMPKD